MEQILAAVISELFKYGLPGLFIAYLIWKNSRLENAIDAKDKRIEDLLEKRVSEAITSTGALHAVAAAQEKVEESLNRIEGVLDRIERQRS